MGQYESVVFTVLLKICGHSSRTCTCCQCLRLQLEAVYSGPACTKGVVAVFLEVGSYFA